MLVRYFFPLLSSIFLTNLCEAREVRTVFKDVYGTQFLVTVDWNSATVSAHLKKNPRKFTDAKLEERMQVAIHFGSAVDCRMEKIGRTQMDDGKVVGALWCPWFGKPIKND